MSKFKWIHVNNKEELEAFYRSRLSEIRQAARRLGYAIGVHGSMQRDLDLIAVPWIVTASDKNELAATIQQAACGLQSALYEWEQKPYGRVATSFPICWTWPSDPMIKSNGHIDLSVIEVRG